MADITAPRVDGRGRHSPARIMAMTIAGQDDGTYTVDVDLNSIYFKELTRLNRQLDRVA